MKKIGKFNLIKETVCELHCKCGWNIQIGGRDVGDLAEIKKYLKRFGKPKIKGGSNGSI